MTSYITGADLPDLEIVWEDADGNIIDFSSGWSFEVKVGKVGQTADFTKTSGITGASTSPNVTVVWADGELDSLSPGAYRVLLTATRDSDGKVRRQQTSLSIDRTTQ